MAMMATVESDAAQHSDAQKPERAMSDGSITTGSGNELFDLLFFHKRGDHVLIVEANGSRGGFPAL